MFSSFYFSLPSTRSDVPRDEFGFYGWTEDFTPDSIVNLALRLYLIVLKINHNSNFRKEDVENFALNNEGNVYNTLFNKASLNIVHITKKIKRHAHFSFLLHFRLTNY